MSYASIADFNARYDARTIAQLSNDQNIPFANTGIIQACLDDATASINAAVLQGSQYAVSDLTALLGSGDTMLVRVCADVALKYLVQRRGMGIFGQLREQVKESSDLLEALRRGQRVLNVSGNRAADTPAMVNLSAAQVQNLCDLTAIPFLGGPRGTRTTAGEI